jgi:hypothetical protein
MDEDELRRRKDADGIPTCVYDLVDLAVQGGLPTQHPPYQVVFANDGESFMCVGAQYDPADRGDDYGGQIACWGSY